MFTKHQKVIGALVIGAVLTAVGCADGQRQNGAGNKNNRRMFRNSAYPGTTNQTQINQKVTGRDQTVTPAANPAKTNPGDQTTAPSTTAGDESQIDARFNQLTQNAAPVAQLPAGSYDLTGLISHVKITTVAKGFAQALVESTFSENGLTPAKTLSSGTLETADEPRTIQLAAGLDVDAKGVAKAPAQAEFILESRAEPKMGKPTIVEQPSPVSDSAPASVSLVRLLAAPNHVIKDATGKSATLKILPQQDGTFVLWISIEEQTVDQSGKQGNTFYRNFFLTFAKSTAPDAGTAATGAVLN